MEVKDNIMELSLTKSQLLERLLVPQRIKLLVLAINEDAHSLFPLQFHSQNQAQINIDITETLRILSSKWLFRAIDLAYDETFDSELPS